MGHEPMRRQWGDANSLLSPGAVVTNVLKVALRRPLI